jgi:hypothetical protein
MNQEVENRRVGGTVRVLPPENKQLIRAGFWIGVGFALVAPALFCVGSLFVYFILSLV